MAPSTPVALVTGGGRNIGLAIALRLARGGYHVAIISREPNEAQVAALEIQALGRRGLALLADVSQEEQVRYVVRRVQSEFGSLDLLVNNASVPGPMAPLHEVDRRDWEEVLSVNLTGAYLCAKAALPGMIERRSGKIVNIASVAGKSAFPLGGPYAISKWGLIGMTQTLAKEVGEYNIRVNAVCPGPVEGERMQATIQRRAAQLTLPDVEVEAAYKQAAALGRFVREEDVAEAVAFLASAAGDNITGQTIDVTAGFGL